LALMIAVSLWDLVAPRAMAAANQL
jgi:hypothetical protein